MKIGELFAGIGGLGLGAAWAFGGHIAWQVECDRHAAAVLRRRAAPGCSVIEGDVRDHGLKTLEPVDLLCGGFPCQDLSVAGTRAGLAGERSGLFWEMVRIVGETRPNAVFIENVPPLFKHRATVDATFEEFGYRTNWAPVTAIEAGAPHRRRRAFVLAVRGDAPELYRRWWRPGWVPTEPAVAAWTTPTVAERDNHGGAAGRVGPVRPGLSNAVLPWPKPTIKGGHNRAGLSPASGDGLETAVRPWPTPCARDYRAGADNDYQERRQGSPGLCDAVLGRLNPDWVETLMGFPVGWTDLDADVGHKEARALLYDPMWPAGWVREAPDRGPQFDWEPPRTMTGPAQRGRPARLRQLGNAVVPAQGALALAQLLREGGV